MLALESTLDPGRYFLRPFLTLSRAKDPVGADVIVSSRLDPTDLLPVHPVLTLVERLAEHLSAPPERSRLLLRLDDEHLRQLADLLVGELAEERQRLALEHLLGRAEVLREHGRGHERLRALDLERELAGVHDERLEAALDVGAGEELGEEEDRRDVHRSGRVAHRDEVLDVERYARRVELGRVLDNPDHRVADVFSLRRPVYRGREADLGDDDDEALLGEPGADVGVEEALAGREVALAGDEGAAVCPEEHGRG
jgi:hypothetical protein